MRRLYTVKKSSNKRNRKSRKVGGMRKSVIQFFNWWDTPSSSEKKFFESFIGKCADSYDEVHIHAAEYSPGNETNGIKMPTYPMSDKILRIQYSGEPSYGHLDKFNINIVPGEHPDTPEYIVNPHMHLFIARYGCPMSTFTEKRKYGGSKEKFCIFTVSNPTANERIRCFNELSKYKKVDSCGKVLNNMSFNCPGNVFSREYIAHTSKYKFNICFENKSMKHYLTEKLAVAYMSGSIPIYWGCSNLSDYINMDAIVYLKPDFTDKDLAALIDEVKALDNDETLYKKKFEQPMFKDGLVPAAFDMNELNKKVCKYIESKTGKNLKLNRHIEGNQTNTFHFYNNFHYGDNIFNLKLLYNISDILKDKNIKIHYYYDSHYIKKLDELERYVDKDVISLHPSSQKPESAIELWMGKDLDGVSHMGNFELYYNKFYKQILKYLELNDRQIDTSLFQKENYLLDIYNKLDPKFKDVDILIINGMPQSGQINIDKPKIDALITDLASKYKVITTDEVNSNITSTRRDGLKIQDIGAISTHAKYIIGIFTGPFTALFNTHTRASVKKWYIINTRPLKFDINYEQIHSMNELNKIIIPDKI